MKYKNVMKNMNNRATVDSTFIIIGFAVIALAVIGFTVKFSALVTSPAAEKTAEQLSYGIMSETDLREILEKAYLKASSEVMLSGGSQSEIDLKFIQYSSEWIKKYFSERGIYNVSINITSGTSPVIQEMPYGSSVQMKYGQYEVRILIGGT